MTDKEHEVYMDCDEMSPEFFANNPKAAAQVEKTVAERTQASMTPDPMRPERADEGVNLEQLNDMINGLVSAMKGE